MERKHSMAAVEAKVTSKGQITIPSRVRDRLKIGPGDRVVFVESTDGEITVRGRSGTLGDMKGMLRGKTGRLKSAAIENRIDDARSRTLPATPKRRGKAR
jgi:antitoxin PrlF